LLMQQESKRYAEQLRREQGRNLQIRVGVNTGEVVLRSIHKDDLHTDYTPVGHSIHLAARLESLARLFLTISVVLILCLLSTRELGGIRKEAPHVPPRTQ